MSIVHISLADKYFLYFRDDPFLTHLVDYWKREDNLTLQLDSTK